MSAAADTTEARLLELVEEQLGLESGRATPTSSFVDDLDADSLDQLDLTMAIEEAFGVTITDDEAATLTTVQDALTLVRGKEAANA